MENIGDIIMSLDMKERMLNGQELKEILLVSQAMELLRK